MNKIITFLSNYKHQENNELEFRFNKLNLETFNKIKDKINSTPQKIIDTIFKNVDYRQRKINEKSEWIKKNQIYSINLSRDLDIKLILVKEIQSNYNNILKMYKKENFTENNVELLRKKNRYSKNLKYWRIDLTETSNFKFINKWIFINKEYELEIELIKNLDNLIENLLEIYEFFKDINLIFPHIIKYYQLTNNFKFIGNNPITLEKKDIPLLIEKNKYSMTLKLDGERKFLIDGILMNTKMDNFIFITNDKNFKDCIFDCEYFDNKIYIFDVLIYQNKDVRNLNLIDRQLLLKDIPEIQNIKIKKFYYPIKIENKPKFIIYTSNIFKRGHKIIETTKIKNDGLIFTPIDEKYNQSKIFKWKDIITLDVLYRNKHFYVISKNELIDITKEISVKEFENNDNKIIELEYNKKNKIWKLFRVRNDKMRPNALLTYKSIITAINDNIGLTELF